MGIRKKRYPILNYTYTYMFDSPDVSLLDDGPAAGDSFYASKWDVGQLALTDLCVNRKSAMCACVVFVTLLRPAVNRTKFTETR